MPTLAPQVASPSQGSNRYDGSVCVWDLGKWRPEEAHSILVRASQRLWRIGPYGPPSWKPNGVESVVRVAYSSARGAVK